MSTIAEVLKAKNIVKKKQEELNEARRLLDVVNENIDLDIIRKCTYSDAKQLVSHLSSFYDTDKNKELKDIIYKKKIEEFPQILDVHYYPIINNIEFLNKEEKIELDRTIKKAYRDPKRYLRSGIDISEMDLKTIKFLLDSSIIKKFYIFRCNCESDECYDKVITQEYFDKLKDYWEKEINGETTDEEDENMNYGCFSTECWNDGDIEICSLEDFSQKLKRIEYDVIKEPDTTLDDI